MSRRTVVYVQATSEVGGSEVALYNLVRHLNPAAYRPVVVLPHAGPLQPMLRAAGVRTVLHPMMQLRPVRDVVYQMAYLARFWPTVSRLARLLRDERADLVHTNSLYSLYGGFAARRAGLPHIWHIREMPGSLGPLRALLCGLALRRSSRVVPMTEAVGGMFRGLRQRPEQVQAVPDGIDLDAFHPRVRGDRIRAAIGVAPGVPLVGFVARLDPWKGPDIFVRAAAMVAERRPETRFLVCGGELPGYQAYAATVKGLANDLGLGDRIAFTGWTFRLQDIPEVMAAIDVLVHTSVRPEPFGLVLVEAMAMQKPVVASSAGGVPEVVEPDVTGLLAEPGDAPKVAQHVLQLLADPARAQAMGRRGRERVRRLFEVGAYAAKIEAVYAAVAS